MSILGFQVKNNAGNHFGNAASNFVFSEKTALVRFQLAKPAGYFMVAVVAGEIENPEFENEFMRKNDIYKTLGVSTGHLNEVDQELLDSMADDPDLNMVMKRDTGFFVKFLDNGDGTVSFPGEELTDNLFKIFCVASDAGYLMLEFDCDATIYDCFEHFDC